MSSQGRAGRYAVGIGSGAAAGAAAGTSIVPGWGTLIGGVVGAAGGAIGAGVNEGKISDAEKRRDVGRGREKKEILLEVLRDQAAKYGYDTRAMDTAAQMRGIDYRNREEDRQWNLQQQTLDPNAFVGMAVNGTKAASGIYNGLNTPNPGPDIPTLQNPGAEQFIQSNQPFQLGIPQAAQEGDEYALDPRRFQLGGGFR